MLLARSHLLCHQTGGYGGRLKFKARVGLSCLACLRTQGQVISCQCRQVRAKKRERDRQREREMTVDRVDDAWARQAPPPPLDDWNQKLGLSGLSGLVASRVPPVAVQTEVTTQLDLVAMIAPK